MSEDLIANNFAENINKAVIKRNIILIQVVLFMAALYSFIICFDWYLILRDLKTTLTENTFYFFIYRLYPLIQLIVLLISFYGLLLTLKANRLIYLSIEKTDAELFNNGYTYFSKASLLSIISLSITIILMLLKFFFKFQI
jgi:hypothetical protein